MRGVVFVIGMLIGGGLLLAMAWAYPGIWLPLAMGCAAASLLMGFPALARQPLTAPFAAAFVLTVPLVWLRSGSASPRTSAQGVSGLFFVLLGLVLVWLAFRFFRAQPSERPLAMPLAALLLFACAIARLSGSGGAADPMLAWFRSVLGLSPEAAGVAVVVLRKTVHFTFYGLFAWIALRAARMAEGERRAAAVLALSLALSLAAFDELRQSVSPGRTGSIWDVALDMTGAVAFVGISTRRRQRHEALGGSLQR